MPTGVAVFVPWDTAHVSEGALARKLAEPSLITYFVYLCVVVVVLAGLVFGFVCSMHRLAAKLPMSRADEPIHGGDVFLRTGIVELATSVLRWFCLLQCLHSAANV